jgi:thiamine-phosphate pyrophosphorylase
MALQRPLVYAVTDRRRCDLSPADLVVRVRDLAQAGVDIIQIRERDLSDRDLLALARQAVSATRGTCALLLVNDRADIAMAAGAAGVHLRGDSIPVARIRRVTPPDFVIGRSVHAIDEAIALARDGGCDYLLFGTIFRSAGKPASQSLAGVDALAAVCRAIEMPVVAIGGIDATNAAAVAAAGAAGLAAVEALVGAPRSGLRAQVTALRRAFDTGSQGV